MPSQRQVRFGELIRSIISNEIIRGDFYNTDFDLSSITVSFVKMSKDLKIASVYIMPLGGHAKEEVLNIFNDNRYLFQRAISREKLKSKFTPKINFYLDNSFEEADRIEKLLLDKKVSRDLG